MNGHFFECELRCTVRVRSGYNLALKEFFLEVGRIGANPSQGFSPFLYSSVDDPFHTGDDLDYYEEKLKKLGLNVPQSLFQALDEDATRGADSRCVQHFADGRMVEGVPK